MEQNKKDMIDTFSELFDRACDLKEGVEQFANTLSAEKKDLEIEVLKLKIRRLFY